MKKINELGLKIQYRKNSTFNFFTKKILALPLLPAADIYDTAIELFDQF